MCKTKVIPTLYYLYLPLDKRGKLIYFMHLIEQLYFITAALVSSLFIVCRNANDMYEQLWYQTYIFKSVV